MSVYAKLKVGDSVFSEVYGYGTVLNMHPTPVMYRYEVKFEGHTGWFRRGSLLKKKKPLSVANKQLHEDQK